MMMDPLPARSGGPSLPVHSRAVFAGPVPILLAAAASACAGQVTPVIPGAAHPLPLSSVRLTGGPLKNAQDLDARYLLALDPDRLLAGYRLRAGLAPKAKGYGGWDSVEGRQLTGHIAGHYLSAVSLMYAATGDVRFKERADQLVRGLQEVQEKRGNGYIGAIVDNKGVDGAVIFDAISRGDIRSTGFDLNGMWSPWYTLHKMFAGLRDAYRHAGNSAALDLEIHFAGWAEKILAPLGDAQIQRMLNTEFGGMDEVLADLYADTGDRRWLDLSRKFEHRAFTGPLKHHQDQLGGLHANTQIPKAIGSLTRFTLTGDPGDGFAAGFFWDRVVRDHSYATGGHGKSEYFGDAGRLSERVDGRTAETCNVYNMLRLTRKLFALRPDAVYADFQERALFNHILASLEPGHGWACYMVPVGRGVEHEYEKNMLDGGFTCCTGTSMESHALHGDGIYHESDSTLWINLYTPSTVDWKAEGVGLRMETGFPMGDSATVGLEMDAPKEFTLAFRRPFWAGDGFAVSVNGEPVSELGPAGKGKSGAPPSAESSFVMLKRLWKPGDKIAITLPKSLRLEPLPDNPGRVAILWGPLVLAGDLGQEGGMRPDAGPDVPVFVASGRPVADWLRPVAGKPGWFRSEGVGRSHDVDFTPFYNLHSRRYAIYWDLFTPEEWTDRSAEIAAAATRQRAIERATVGFVQPGEMQAERDANMQGEETAPDRLMGRAGRRAAKWFSFDLPVDPTSPMALVVTYNSDEWRDRAFRISVDGTEIARQEIPQRGPVRFFDVEYPLPSGLVKGKRTVTVKFQATGTSETGCVFGIRMIRADPKPVSENAP